MSPYLAFIRKSFIKNMAYRAEIWIKVFGNLLLIFIQVSLWKSLIGNKVVNGVSLEEMITYSVITTVTFNILMTNSYEQVDDKLKTGGISTDLQKPISYPLQLFSDQLGLVLSQFCVTVFPVFIVSLIMFDIRFPAKENILPYLISLLLAILLSYLLGFLIALISFRILTTFALSWILNSFVIVFSGTFLPLWFFTPFFQKLALSLPFQYLGFVPTSIYLGIVPNPLFEITKGCIWVFILILIALLLWKKSIKSLVVQGG